MLETARAGCFSYVAIGNVERFGRNDTEALMAINETWAVGTGWHACEDAATRVISISPSIN